MVRPVDSASTAGGTGSIPGQKTKIPQAEQHGQKKKKKMVQGSDDIPCFSGL